MATIAQNAFNASLKGVELITGLFKTESEKQIEAEKNRAAEIMKSTFEANKAILENDIATYSEMLTNASISTEKKEELAGKLAEAETALAAETAEYTTAVADQNAEKVKAGIEKTVEIMQGVGQIATEIMSAISAGYQNQIEELEALQEKNNEYFDQQQENLDNTMMSEERRAEEQKRLDEERAASEKKTQDEIAALKLKQAKLDKAQAIMNAVINTATAILMIWAQVPKMDFAISTIALTAVAAAMGAIQIATIAAQPLPKYARGGTDVSGWGMFGEAGSELAVNRTQGLLLASEPTVTKFDPHTTIFNAADTARLLAGMNENDKRTTTEIDYDRIDEIMKRNRAQQVVNLDSRGLAGIIKGNGIQYFINRKKNFKN
jgi:hypothetical protein